MTAYRILVAAVCCAAVCCAASILPLQAQPLVDTVLTWQGYGRAGQGRVQVYPAPPKSERPHTVVLQEVAANQGPSVVQDVAYLAEEVGRRFGIDPVAATWIVYWGSFSYRGAEPHPQKPLFIRAVFRRTRRGQLGAPAWRVLSREEVEDHTDRRFR